MYVIQGLRLNKFQYVKLPSRRQLYDQLNKAGLIHNQVYEDGRESDDPYNSPVNAFEGKSKIDAASEAAEMFQQALNIEKEKSK